MRIMAYEPETDEIFEVDLNIIIARIESCFQVSKEHARKILEDSTIDCPCVLPRYSCEYWSEK